MTECYRLECTADRQKLKRLLGERDEWRQELDNLRRLLRRAESRVAEEHSWYVAAEASLATRTNEVEKLQDLINKYQQS